MSEITIREEATNHTPVLFISWHHSRRTRILADALESPLYAIQIENSVIKRHLLSSIWTLSNLFQHRPKIIILQYSFLLLIIAICYKLLSAHSVTVVSDCHTKALKRKLHGPLAHVFFMLKRWSLAMADLIVVSNEGLAEEAAKYNKRLLVLPDLIPDLRHPESRKVNTAYCVFVVSYAEDEPIDVMLQAAVCVSRKLRVFITGNAPREIQQRYELNSEIEFTGFLPDKYYLSLLSDADCIIALTSEEDCLQCTGYEALALEVPFVTSNTNALRKYFGDAATYVENDLESVVAGIFRSTIKSNEYKLKMAALKKIMKSKEAEKLQQLKKYMGQ